MFYTVQSNLSKETCYGVVINNAVCLVGRPPRGGPSNLDGPPEGGPPALSYNLLYCVVTAPSWSETITVFFKFSFSFGLNNQFYETLKSTVVHGRRGEGGAPQQGGGQTPQKTN